MKASKFEWQVMVKIAARADSLYENLGMERPHRLTFLMDMEHAHAHMPMDLSALLEGKDSDFSHDIGGIQRHINRETGKLEDCFVPRFAIR